MPRKQSLTTNVPIQTGRMQQESQKQRLAEQSEMGERLQRAELEMQTMS